MRVLMVNDLLPGPGSGTEVYVDRLVRALTGAGHSVRVFEPPGPRLARARWRDVWDPEVRRRVRRAAQGCDIVHVHNFSRELSPAVLDAAPEVPLVCTVHDHRLFVSDRPGARWSPLTLVSRRLVTRARRGVRRHARQVVAVSAELAARLDGAGIGPVTVVPPFADPDPAAWQRSARTDIVYAGRLGPGKGVDVLLDAFAAVVDAVPAARLRIAGDGPDRNRLMERADARGVASRVRFEGLLGEAAVDALLHDAAVVCVPSVAAEGLPLLCVEAMLVGRPIVASDLPSLRTVLGDGTRGALVARGDADALAATIVALLQDPARADSLGRAARAEAEREYTTAVALARMRTVYDAAVASGG